MIRCQGFVRMTRRGHPRGDQDGWPIPVQRLISEEHIIIIASQPLRWQGSVKSGDSSPRIKRVVASWTWDIRRVACPASFPGQSPHCACSQPKRLASLRIMKCVVSVFMETGSPFAQFWRGGLECCSLYSVRSLLSGCSLYPTPVAKTNPKSRPHEPYRP
jgi:hypothetical protein